MDLGDNASNKDKNKPNTNQKTLNNNAALHESASASNLVDCSSDEDLSIVGSFNVLPNGKVCNMPGKMHNSSSEGASLFNSKITINNPSETANSRTSLDNIDENTCMLNNNDGNLDELAEAVGYYSSDDETNSEKTKSKKSNNKTNLRLRASKHIASLMMGSRSSVKPLLDANSSQVLDNFYALLKLHVKPKKEARSLINELIRIVVKLGVVVRQCELTEAERKKLGDLQAIFRNICLVVTGFDRDEYMTNRRYLADSLYHLQTVVIELVHKHVSQNSVERIDRLFSRLSKDELLDQILSDRHSQSDKAVKFRALRDSLSTLIGKPTNGGN